MKQTILYDEAYEYNIHFDQSTAVSLHFDYGTRYNRINMHFPHFHPNYEIYFLLNGNALHFVEGTVYDIQAHDFVLLKPYRLHKTSYFEKTPCKRLVFTFDSALFDKLFPEASQAFKEPFNAQQPVFRFGEEITHAFIELFNNMYKTSKEQKPTSHVLILSYFIQLLAKLTDFRRSNKYFIGSNNNSSLVNKIYEITSYIHTHYKENLTLASLSKKFYISPHYLSRQFKSVTTFTLIQYIQETRIKKAQELLLDTDLKIIEIIDACGFGSLSQFNRVFNKLVHCSPSSYRSENKLHD
ncbi:helix-turn-helix transcriptional regulator [Vallitalea pronyensis]|uniref:Helix-turn-helix transcriptional regulator n=1 Tax=Vallitalea pronyensis TaxID=1348613 RepID=A0A8J8SIN3_9FIRM|nr:AraC family transcriptional regulator [Vallitalea pronyensis]QUI24627.1 helix-turn-helix transcriptional regulator [Vallitalea pronyensis]